MNFYSSKPDKFSRNSALDTNIELRKFISDDHLDKNSKINSYPENTVGTEDIIIKTEDEIYLKKNKIPKELALNFGLSTKNIVGVKNNDASIKKEYEINQECQEVVINTNVKQESKSKHHLQNTLNEFNCFEVNGEANEKVKSIIFK